MVKEKRKPDVLRALTSYLIPICIVIGVSFVALHRIGSTEEEMERKVNKDVHVVQHDNVDLRINHVEQAVLEVAQRVETINYQAQIRHDRALKEIMEAVK